MSYQDWVTELIRSEIDLHLKHLAVTDFRQDFQGNLPMLVVKTVQRELMRNVQWNPTKANIDQRKRELIMDC